MEQICSSLFVNEPLPCAVAHFTGLLTTLAAKPSSTAKAAPRLAAAFTTDGIATVAISGILAHKPSLEAMASGLVEDIGQLHGLIQAVLKSRETRGLLLEVDSAGSLGLSGVPELADTIRQARVPTVAWIGGLALAGGYWLASQCARLICSTSAQLGGLGAFVAIMDTTKLYESMGVSVEVIRNAEGDFKAAGLPGTSLTPVQREQLQADVDAAANMMRSAVVAARPGIEPSAMRGQCFLGNGARKAGLADAVGSRKFALSALRQMISP